MKKYAETELLLKLHDKIDGISTSIKEIEIVQVKHEMNLQTHMRRSEASENRLELIEAEVKPILQGLSFLKVIAKIGASLISLAYAAAKFFR